MSYVNVYLFPNTGGQLEVRILKTDLISDVKRSIEEKYPHYPARAIDLLHCGRSLKDNDPVERFDFTTDTGITLVLDKSKQNAISSKQNAISVTRPYTVHINPASKILLPIELLPTDSVLRVKEKIENKYPEFPASCIDLLYRGKSVNDNQVIDFSIETVIILKIETKRLVIHIEPDMGQEAFQLTVKSTDTVQQIKKVIEEKYSEFSVHNVDLIRGESATKLKDNQIIGYSPDARIRLCVKSIDAFRESVRRKLFSILVKPRMGKEPFRLEIQLIDTIEEIKKRIIAKFPVDYERGTINLLYEERSLTDNDISSFSTKTIIEMIYEESSDSNAFTVYVKQHTNKHPLPLKILPTDTVLRVKNKIEMAYPTINATSMDILFRGKTLRDDQVVDFSSDTIIVLAPETSKKAPCRFGHKCFDPNCYSAHEVPFCINRENCRDFYCQNRHYKNRKRPCAAGGDCAKKDSNCPFLHPTSYETIMVLDNPIEKSYLQEVAKKCKVSFDITNNRLRVSSNRGQKFVDEFINQIKEVKTITIPFNKDLKLAEIGMHADILGKFIENYFKTNLFFDISTLWLERQVIIKQCSQRPITQQQFIEELHNLNEVSFHFRNGSNVSTQFLEETSNSNYIVTVDKKGNECKVFSFDSLDTPSARNFIFRLKDFVNANVVQCDIDQLAYLRMFSKTFRRLMHHQIACVTVKETPKEGLILINKVECPGYTETVENLVIFEIEKTTKQTYQDVLNVELFRLLLETQTDRIVISNKQKSASIVDQTQADRIAMSNKSASSIDHAISDKHRLANSIDIVIPRSEFLELDKYIMERKSNFIVEHFVNPHYKQYLKSTKKFPANVTNATVTKSGRLLIFDRSMESLETSKLALSTAEQFIKALIKIETLQYIADEWKPIKKYAKQAADKHGACLTQQKEGKVVSVSISGVGPLVNKALDEINNYQEKRITYPLKLCRDIEGRADRFAKEHGVEIDYDYSNNGVVNAIVILRGRAEKVNEIEKII